MNFIMAPKKKIYVLDTNAISHDSLCINQFKGNDIVVPVPAHINLDKRERSRWAELASNLL